jgi:hypothetical protein
MQENIRRKEENKSKTIKYKDTTICLPEFGFYTKPMSPLRCPKALGLFKPSQVILKIKIDPSLFNSSLSRQYLKSHKGTSSTA